MLARRLEMSRQADDRVAAGPDHFVARKRSTIANAARDRGLRRRLYWLTLPSDGVLFS